MSQIPDGMMSASAIQAKVGELAALYAQYKGIDPDALPYAAHQMFSPNDLQMLQYVDAHPEVQQLLQQYQAQQDALDQMDAAQPRMWEDGRISTTAERQREEAEEAAREGLNNVTSNLLGAMGQTFGQYLYPDDPVMASRVGSFYAHVGEGLLAAGETAGIAHETSHYTPAPVEGGIYAPHEPPLDPKLSVPPGQNIPGVITYNPNETEVVGRETEVVGDHTTDKASLPDSEEELPAQQQREQQDQALQTQQEREQQDQALQTQWQQEQGLQAQQQQEREQQDQALQTQWQQEQALQAQQQREQQDQALQAQQQQEQALQAQQAQQQMPEGPPMSMPEGPPMSMPEGPPMSMPEGPPMSMPGE